LLTHRAVNACSDIEYEKPDCSRAGYIDFQCCSSLCLNVHGARG
jgi:hypothetical protein